MTRRPPPLLIAGGQLWPSTAAVVEGLAAPGAHGQRCDLLIWDERDADGRWTDRPSTFVVRTRPLRTIPAEHGRPAIGARAGDLELRAHLWRRRHADVALVGRVALDAAPWLRRHAGRRIWLPTPEDLAALDAGLTIPPATDGGPHHVVTTEPAVARSSGLAGEARHRWEPGFAPVPPSDGTGQVILAWGPPTRLQGIDLVGRSLAARAHDLRSCGARVRWIAPQGAAISDEEHADLRRAGVDDLVEIVPAADPEQAFRDELVGAASMVRCARPGGTTPDDETLVRAYRQGVHAVGFDEPASDLALDLRWTRAAFGDVTAVADALVAAATRPAAERAPGPVGLASLLHRIGTEAGRG